MDKSTRRELWANHMKRWEASGLSISQYCQQEEIKQYSFYYWKKHLAKNRELHKAKSLFSRVDITNNTAHSEFSPVWVANFLKELLK